MRWSCARKGESSIPVATPIASTVLAWSALKPIEADDLHCVREMARGIAQLERGLRHVGALGGGTKRFHDRVVGCASEKSLRELSLAELRTSAPCRHDFGQSGQITAVILRFSTFPQRAWEKRNRAVSDRFDARSESAGRKYMIAAQATLRGLWARAVSKLPMILPTLVLPTHPLPSHSIPAARTNSVTNRMAIEECGLLPAGCRTP